MSDRREAKRTRRIRLILDISIIIWLLGVVTITIPRTPWAEPSDGRIVLAIPFKELVWEPRKPHPAPWLVVAEMLANLMLFFPLGFLLPLRWPVWQDFRKLLATAALSALAIESLQFVLGFGRSSSATDVVLNTSGAGLGYAVFSLSRKISPS